MTTHTSLTSIFRLRVHTLNVDSMRANTTVRRVAEAVVAVLREPCSHEAQRRLATCRLKEWESSYHWLDANGLALYFRDTVRVNQLQSSLQPEVLERLDQNYADNKSRLDHQLVEFRVINQRLQAAGIRYANLKGFALEPNYCRDLSLRHQCDLDFMARCADRNSCRAVLVELGYRLTSEGTNTLEFKPKENRIPDIADLYKPRTQQPVEVHFPSPTRMTGLGEDSLDRIVWIDRFGLTFPRLSEADMFFSLIFHLYGHLLSEWIRLSWFYELACYLKRHTSNDSFLYEISQRAAADPLAAKALALVLAFSIQAFSRSLPEPLAALCRTNLGESTQLWVLNYGAEMLLSDFPGNKLYLLLLRELSAEPKDWQEVSRKRLLPFHTPGRALHGSSWGEQVRHIPGNTRYGLSRVKFHAREGFRYLQEQWRWKRRIAKATLLQPWSD